jgi:hypothetical protein
LPKRVRGPCWLTSTRERFKRPRAPWDVGGVRYRKHTTSACRMVAKIDHDIRLWYCAPDVNRHRSAGKHDPAYQDEGEGTSPVPEQGRLDVVAEDRPDAPGIEASLGGHAANGYLPSEVQEAPVRRDWWGKVEKW